MNQVNQRQDYRRVPNPNFIPPEYRTRLLPSRKLMLRILLVVMIAGGAFIVTNLYQQRSALQASIESAQQKVQQADKDLAAANAKKEDATKLQATLEALKTQNEATRQDWALAMDRADWSRVMATLFQSESEDVQLRSITTQGNNQVTVAGTAVDYVALLLFQNKLQASPIISRVISLSSNKAESSLSFSLVAEVKTSGK